MIQTDHIGRSTLVAVLLITASVAVNCLESGRGRARNCTKEIVLLRPATPTSDQLVVTPEGINYLKNLGPIPIEIVSFFGTSEPEVYFAYQGYVDRNVCYMPSPDINVKIMPHLLKRKMPGGEFKIGVPIKLRLIQRDDFAQPRSMYAIQAKMHAVTGVIASGFSYDTLAYHRSDLWRLSQFQKVLRQRLVKAQLPSSIDSSKLKVGPIYVKDWDKRMYCRLFKYKQFVEDFFWPLFANTTNNSTSYADEYVKNVKPERDNRTSECLMYSWGLKQVMEPIVGPENKSLNALEMAEFLEALVQIVNQPEFEEELGDNAMMGQFVMENYVLQQMAATNKTINPLSVKRSSALQGFRLVEGFPHQEIRYTRRILGLPMPEPGESPNVTQSLDEALYNMLRGGRGERKPSTLKRLNMNATSHA